MFAAAVACARRYPLKGSLRRARLIGCPPTRRRSVARSGLGSSRFYTACSRPKVGFRVPIKAIHELGSKVSTPPKPRQSQPVRAGRCLPALAVSAVGGGGARARAAPRRSRSVVCGFGGVGSEPAPLGRRAAPVRRGARPRRVVCFFGGVCSKHAPLGRAPRRTCPRSGALPAAVCVRRRCVRCVCRPPPSR